MNIKKLSTILFLLLIQISLCYSQQSIKEEDYTLFYGNSKIDLQFNNDINTPILCSAIDVMTNKKVDFSVDEKNFKNYTLENLYPSEIIKIDYYFPNEKTVIHHSSYVANASLSSGTIDVFFNHVVNTNYSQIQNAVNLANTLDDKLITYINACANTLDITIYNSYSPSSTSGIAGAINAAFLRGVQVRLIYDGSTSSVMIPLLNPSIPVLASPTSVNYGIMHNKFVIFDANSIDANKPLVWTGSTNWTLAQIDGPDKNNAIVIQDQTLALGYKIEFDEMWGATSGAPNIALSKFGLYKTDNTPHTYTIGGKIVNSYFSPSDGTNAKIIATINTANTDIEIATMLITRSDITNALLAKYNNGITNTDIVVDSQNPSGNQFSTIQTGLTTNHAKIYSAGGIMHHKFMVVDNFNSASDPLVLLGSHNWSSSAETKNDENILIVHDLNIANQYYQAFAYLYQQAGGTITVPLSTNENDYSVNNIIIHPNPSIGIFTVDCIKSSIVNEVEIDVFDILGKKIYANHYSDLFHKTIDLSKEAVGIYFITIQSGTKSLHFKVVKQ